MTDLRHIAAGVAGPALLLLLAAQPAGAQSRPVGVNGITPIVNGGYKGWDRWRGGRHVGRPGRYRGGFGGYILVEREVPVIIEREIIREVLVEPPPPPPAPREPYVIGKSYASLPSPCMKMIEDGESYYHCSGQWYRQAGARYQAVRMP